MAASEFLILFEDGIANVVLNFLAGGCRDAFDRLGTMDLDLPFVRQVAQQSQRTRSNRYHPRISKPSALFKCR
ncbi:hypothetical protein ATM17_40660 (plasmid) [Sphingopyxis macrogoltabida]|uniref:Uncharacterized protein n=1 Tax=Sphingopyxis macrogoltabida TaxID=33050 RepID=A0AAC9AZP1_SPHMC|nr:hypothetical protein ATM17_40660 [Sphingopyxis macrogoltabida]